MGADVSSGVSALERPPGGVTPLVRAAPSVSAARRREAAASAPVPRISPRKRIFDLVVGSAALAVLAPLLSLIWMLVRLTSPGPGLYWSQRVGRGRRVFWMPKFRTMQHGAPNTPREHLADAAAHITSVGAVLRRWSLDELPQLWCIVVGDMSFIGPRPLLPNDPAQAARSEYPEALALRPGLSGLAQIRGRNHVSPRRKARLDAFYARSRTGVFDLAIFTRTVVVLVTGRGFL